MNRVALAALGVALLMGCRDQRSVTSPASPRIAASISDGGHENCVEPAGPCVPSNPHFFFLPPMVERQDFTGTFNPNLAPVVQICTLAASVCDPGIAPINPGPAPVGGDHYQVDWNTAGANLSTTRLYRIEVFATGELLGFADLQVVTNGSQLKKPNTGEVVGVVNGRTLPIKFRIENGALCFGHTDCGESVVGPAGGTVVTSTGLAGAFFPPGALAATVTVTIQAVSERPCLPIDLLQRSGCYEFRTDPGPNTFNLLVTAGICVDIEGLTPTEISLLHLHQEDFIEGSPVVTSLSNVAAHFLTCDAPHPPPPLRGLGSAKVERLLALGKQGVRTLVSIFVPRPLFAAHLGVGGLTGSFSRIGWALPAQMTKGAGDGQTVPVGTAVATPPSVIVKDSSGAPVPGEAVTFTVGSGGGSVTGGAATTDASGVAAVGSWMLGLSAGANTLIATSRGAVGSLVTFTATGTAPSLGSWTTKGSMPTVRFFVGVGAINGILYVVGGKADNNFPVATVEAYDPATDTWTTKTPLPTPRQEIGAATLNGKIYVVGGTDPTQVYDPTTDTWTPRAPLPTRRDFVGVVALNGKLYAVGGGPGQGELTVYDPATDTWTSKSPMPTPRYGVAVGVVDGVIYAVGGYGLPPLPNAPVATVEAYDPTTDKWTTKAPLPGGQNYPGAGVIDGTLYSVGYPDLEAYDPASDTWTARTSMPTVRFGVGVGALNGLLYAVGGATGGFPNYGAVGTLEAYRP